MSWTLPEVLSLLVKASYLVAAALFLLGLQRMASPRTARSGIQWAGVGMLLATVATFFLPGLENIALILVAIAIATLLWADLDNRFVWVVLGVTAAFGEHAGTHPVDEDDAHLARLRQAPAPAALPAPATLAASDEAHERGP